MKKVINKFIAFLVTFVMTIALIPLSTISSLAAGIDEFASKGTNDVQEYTFSKVNSLSSGQEYVIVYNYNNEDYALAWDGSQYSAIKGTVNNGKFTVSAEQSDILWSVGSNSFTNKEKVLKGNSNSQLPTDNSGKNLYVRDSNQIGFKSKGNTYYLSYDGTNWRTSSSSNSNFTFYKVSYEGEAEDTLKPDSILGSDDTVQGGDYPEYPNQGSVRVNKNATSEDFNGTGVAKVQLGVTGVPVKKGVDVVLVLDISGSMEGTKLTNLKKSAKDFVDILLGNNADGSKSSNRLGLVTFSQDDNSRCKIQYALKNAYGKTKIEKTIDDLTADGGTDYDSAFSNASKVLEGASASRDKYVVFMTDGGPSGFTNKDGTRYHYTYGMSSWDATNIASVPYLKGAEDIKTSGVKVYSIGLGLNKPGNNYTASQAKTIAANLSSNTETNKDYYVSVDDDDAQGTKLNKAFTNIASAIKKAGQNAVVTDVVGSAFDLQTSTTLPNDKGTLSESPNIEVKLYDLYTLADFNKGTITDRNQIGTRKPGNPTVVETVTFNSDGTATSSLKSGNILTKQGNTTTISAEKFTYTRVDKSDGSNTETFSWRIGDITEQEATISYYAYLRGSMEGNRGNGVYDTNESAVLNYDNYLGNKAHKDFTKPKMPWGSAVVNYEFYLVNEKGQPVNSRGEVVPFAERVTIGKPQQKEFNWNNKTEVTASIVANKLVPEGYELYINDTVYTANATSKGEGSCTITETVPVGSLGSGKNGSSTNVYQYDEGYTNSYVAFGVKNKTTLIPDSIVIDYGKSIDIDVMKNDRVLNATLDSIATIDTNLGNITLGEGFTNDRKDGFKNSISTKQANISVATDKSVITYTPTAYMDSVDQFYYAAKDETSDGKGGEITSYRYQTVKVIPATTVYYEDNFGNTTDENTTNGIVYSGSWSTVDETDGTTPEDKQDNKDVTDKDGHQYGSDDSYQNDTKLSNGSAKVTTGDGTASASATFTFKGTGFDLISRTNNSTGLIQYKIYRGDKAEGTPIFKQNLNTVYKDEGGDLYQIPVINWSSETYDTYTVKITVSRNAIFYLDAIRIYNPVGLDNETANNQYKKDKEANPVIKEVRNLLIESGKLSTDETKGAVFVETAGKTSSIVDYINKGPNNEVYLKPNQSVVFNIRSTEKPTSVQIGAKAPNGSSSITVGSGIDDKQISLTSATDMYYNVSSAINWSNDDNSSYATVIITNNGTSDTIASITNLKLTYDNSDGDYYTYVNQSIADEASKVATKRMSVLLDNTDNSTEKDTNSNEQDKESNQDNSQEETTKNNPIKDFFNNLFSKWFK